MPLKIYNSLGRTLEEFKPLQPGKVKMYVCGPTVYDLLHVGNFRGAIFFNLVRNWLTHFGYQVTFVYNYTDIDDKIINRAKEEGKDPLVLSRHYIEEFQKDFARLHLTPHDINPLCTDHIPQMVDFIQTLIDKGFAYAVDGEVFFETTRFKEYGKLSGKNVDDLQMGHRVDPNPLKRNPLDFVLWKPAKDGEPGWDSPWGKGRPGWHIECSVMNHVHLGRSIDIHGGGIDLTFPHHENEIAQSEAANGAPFVRYWMHNNFINFADAKMSKSLGNVVKAREFMDRYHPEILKFMMLSVHYHSPLNLAEDQVHQAIAGLSRIYAALKTADDILAQGVEGRAVDKAFEKELQQFDQLIEEAMNADFNTPGVYGTIFDMVRRFNAFYKPGKKANPDLNFKAEAFKEWVLKHGKLMALFQEPPADFLKAVDEILIREKKINPQEVEDLIAGRNEARAGKDFAAADAIREKLTAMDVIVHDTASGTTWEMKKG